MNEMRRFLIIFMGTDGVGKSTHARMIHKYLADKGIMCKYEWLRIHHLISLPLLAYCRLIGLTKYEVKNGQRIGRHEFYRSQFVSNVYPSLLFMDMALVYIVKIAFPSLLGKSIICDRYIYDTLVDLMISLNDFELFNKETGKVFLRLIPNDAKSLLIDLDEETIRERARQNSTKPNSGELLMDETVETRRKLYRKIAEDLNIPIINNSDPIDVVQQKIIKYLGI